jgi:hypothetical protein
MNQCKASQRRSNAYSSMDEASQCMRMLARLNRQLDKIEIFSKTVTAEQKPLQPSLHLRANSRGDALIKMLYQASNLP